MDGAAITRRVKAGRLHRVHRGVYAIGHPQLGFEGWCMAAVLACGSGSVVSHQSAAALWGMLRPEDRTIHITIPTANGRKPQVGIRIHRTVTLRASDATGRRGIPVTRPSRTLRDLQPVVSGSLYLYAVRRALDRRLISKDQLQSVDEVTRSRLERRFLALCRRHGLPGPLVNTKVGRYEVDFLWIDHSLIAETDGWGSHGSRAAFEADRARDADLQAQGYRVVRFTWRQVLERPKEVVGALRRLMER